MKQQSAECQAVRVGVHMSKAWDFLERKVLRGRKRIYNSSSKKKWDDAQGWTAPGDTASLRAIEFEAERHRVNCDPERIVSQEVSSADVQELLM